MFYSIFRLVKWDRVEVAASPFLRTNRMTDGRRCADLWWSFEPRTSQTMKYISKPETKIKFEQKKPFIIIFQSIPIFIMWSIAFAATITTKLRYVFLNAPVPKLFNSHTCIIILCRILYMRRRSKGNEEIKIKNPRRKTATTKNSFDKWRVTHSETFDIYCVCWSIQCPLISHECANAPQ